MSESTAATKCACVVVINNPQRAARFKDIFDKDEVPIKGPFRTIGRAHVPDVGEVRFDAYLLDKTRCTENQLVKIAKAAAPAFALSAAETLDNVLNPKCDIPINDKDTTVRICPMHNHMLMSLAMEDDEGFYDDSDDDDDFDEEEYS